MFVHQPDAAPPGGVVERIGVEEGAERERRHDERGADRGCGSARAGEEQPLASEPIATFGDELLDLLPSRRVPRQRVVLLELLGHDQPFRDDDQRSRDEGKGESQREAEVLGLVAEVVERVDGDESGEPLRVRVGRPRRHDPVAPLEARLPLLPPEEQDEERDHPAPKRAHRSSLRPITRQQPTSATPASSQVTRPSGTGPMRPRLQPPRSSGCFACWT